MKYKYFDIRKNTFTDPVTGDKMEFHIFYDILGNPGRNVASPRLNNSGTTFYMAMNDLLGFEDHKDMVSYLNSKEITIITSTTTLNPVPTITVYTDELYALIDAFDEALTERYGKTGKVVDKRQRLAGHVRLEFE